MRKNKTYIFGFLFLVALLVMGCGTYTGGYSSGYGPVNHYHYGHGGGWGNPYYHGGGPVIIVDDVPDIPDVPDFGPPEAVELPDMDW